MFELLVEVIHIDTFHMNGNIVKHKSTLHVHNIYVTFQECTIIPVPVMILYILSNETQWHVFHH